MSEQKIEQFWRDATADDIAKVMRGEKVEARFRYKIGGMKPEKWRTGWLNGWTSGSKQWYCESIGYGFFEQCQVYDPPEWYVNKPDPGEGYRLLEKFPDEDLQKGDEIWVDGSWCYSWRANNAEDTQKETKWYRRRIEPNTPEKPDSCVAYEAEVGEVIELPNGKRLKVTQSGFEVL